jgi:hypothetical protein
MGALMDEAESRRHIRVLEETRERTRRRRRSTGCGASCALDSTREEAAAYLAHPVLGPRLVSARD